MSRKVADALVRLVESANALQPERQRGKTIANLVDTLEKRHARTVPTRWGELRFLTTRGRHVAGATDNFFGNEPETLAWLDGLPEGEVLWDIGAAFGQFALYAGRRGLRVVAIEPKATSYGLLVEHVALNGLGDRVMPLCLALSDRAGRTTLQLSGLDAGGALNTLAGSVTSWGETPGAFEQSVFTAPLNQAAAMFDLPAPDHLKLDVDGLEAVILENGVEQLRSVKSALVEIEGTSAANSEQRILRPLSSAGLREDPSMRNSGSGRNRLFVR